jgi:hypothetical protein
MHMCPGDRTVTGTLVQEPSPGWFPIGGMHLTRGRMRTSWFKNRHRVGFQWRDTNLSVQESSMDAAGVQMHRMHVLNHTSVSKGTDANLLVQEPGLPRDGCEPLGSRTVTSLVSNGGMHLTRGLMRTSWFKDSHRVGFQWRDAFNQGTDANLLEQKP